LPELPTAFAFLSEQPVTGISQIDHAVISVYIEFMRQRANPRVRRRGLVESKLFVNANTS
jgi:hypothetical protein